MYYLGSSTLRLVSYRTVVKLVSVSTELYFTRILSPNSAECCGLWDTPLCRVMRVKGEAQGTEHTLLSVSHTRTAYITLPLMSVD